MRYYIVTAILTILCIAGCYSRHIPDTGHGDLADAIFGRRHTQHLPHDLPSDSLLALAKEVTRIEDIIRRDGTITAKQPDVWGDAGLTHYIQEYDDLLADSVNDFDSSIQALVARTDRAAIQSETSLAFAVGKGGTVPGSTSIVEESDKTTTNVVNLSDPGLIDLPTADSLALLESAAKSSKSGKEGIALEPTEVERQRSTFINVNQALRRRNMGSDTARAPGYAMYKFRLPVSVLPGRETSRGYSAVVTFRAQPRVDAAHLQYAFPKLVIGDLVDTLTPQLLLHWKEGFSKKQDNGKPENPSSTAKQLQSFEKTSQNKTYNAISTPRDVSIPVASSNNVFGIKNLNALLKEAKENFEGTLVAQEEPKYLELRNFLTSYFAQLNNVIEERKKYEQMALCIVNATEKVTKGLDASRCRTTWISNFENPGNGISENENYARTSWLLAIQSGIFDHNLKKILREMQLKGKLSENDAMLAHTVQFFGPVSPGAAQLWETIVREEFPIHVFALDPDVEEQNVHDAFSRRREMQLALAIGVASKTFGLDQRLAASRQLELDMASIDLNRIAVGFSHGNDTFGWYFHPRVQSPPSESTNIGAFARTLWSTGPTEHYDLKHRKLEPGIRECEVLVVMPSFVTQIDFDVTTNWEKLTRPGATKRSYEEMIALGGEVHRLKNQLHGISDQNCFRPGDYARLISRIEQLEKMLGLQTFNVSVPYEYELAGTELFSTGDVHLRPVVTGFYGLDYLAAKGEKETEINEASVFLTGKHFHPTLTHVIVGGTEVDSIKSRNEKESKVAVEVISRELLQVTVKNLNKNLTNSKAGFVLRVGTPYGVSGPIRIGEKAAPKKEEPKGFGIKENETTWSGQFTKTNGFYKFVYSSPTSIPGAFTLVNKTGKPLPLQPTAEGIFVARITGKYKDGKAVTFSNQKNQIDTLPEGLIFNGNKLTIPVNNGNSDLSKLIAAELNSIPPLNAKEVAELSVTIYVKFGQWPVEALLDKVTIKIDPDATLKIKVIDLNSASPTKPKQVTPMNSEQEKQKESLPPPVPKPESGTNGWKKSTTSNFQISQAGRTGLPAVTSLKSESAPLPEETNMINRFENTSSFPRIAPPTIEATDG